MKVNGTPLSSGEGRRSAAASSPDPRVSARAKRCRFTAAYKLSVPAPKEVPPLSWCGPEGADDYDVDRFLETASRVMARRGCELREGMRRLYRRIFRETGSRRGGEAHS